MPRTRKPRRASSRLMARPKNPAAPVTTAMGPEEGACDLLEGARAFVRRAETDPVHEIGRQRPLRTGDGERRGDWTGAQADAEPTVHFARPQQRVELRGRRGHIHDIEWRSRRAEALQGHDEGVERVRQHVQQLASERTSARAVRVKTRRPKGEVAVNEGDRPQPRATPQQPAEGRVANELVAWADEEPALARQLEQGVGLLPRLDERFLDVDMCPREQRLPGS